MDPKMMELSNLRVLNDYLNHAIDALVRSPRAGVGANGYAASLGANGYAASLGANGYGGLGQSPFTAGPFGAGADVVPSPLPPLSSTIGLPYQAFGQAMPFGVTGFGAPYQGAIDPFQAQRGAGHTVGGLLGGQWSQTWAPIAEAARQAQITQALVARQSVLEAICRVAGIPV